jgi:hypothetical protein
MMEKKKSKDHYNLDIQDTNYKFHTLMQKHKRNRMKHHVLSLKTVKSKMGANMVVNMAILWFWTLKWS